MQKSHRKMSRKYLHGASLVESNTNIFIGGVQNIDINILAICNVTFRILKLNQQKGNLCQNLTFTFCPPTSLQNATIREIYSQMSKMKICRKLGCGNELGKIHQNYSMFRSNELSDNHLASTYASPGDGWVECAQGPRMVNWNLLP